MKYSMRFQAATPHGFGRTFQCGGFPSTRAWVFRPLGTNLPSGASICYPLFPMTRTSPKEDSAPATKADIAELRQLLSSKFEESDKCFDRIEAKLTEHDGRFERIEAKLSEHDRRFDRIEGKLEEHDKRFDLYDKQFDRILEMLYGDKDEREHGALPISLQGRIYRLERYLGLAV